ncbi:S-adenosylmethionine-6-N',N'-adenosyl(rRNA) dimethyltransferase [Aeropyrum pernix K1]|uniref:Probable ribosomal RNA small subunit methyltransferase A n=1 Tax=Aeropyrum pernix (strain ATCC 700893 / DSM 11879 / JCM 9820 / NBRC 100138 / K1) TaxID=272557 RepID=RSMA_AERPE|nr:16S rRNA (adenine(1518)-N(6)/adenine(1519)-N(6))-dimethyltransferase RsmA [Aeropyrum pernix]Q9YEM5.1 RecName: Full=Probable ribosomal RNA small subunit methyltransferase A; AltName: Full=16S rRNA dimethyladenosine transferase; AltName: Full=16S rRNA dimethylase; AltName: Full=S-adenosylmethionine-6-N',N'-adenosyl(rRNA) dimethyltransferase [Aeropyrum pernix K1]BAA79521.1 S-adenosylmethionine-6-N',N'-adenosyl(rRNA) dimethyltransferase [Aeropyrum pernix K1]
MPPGSGRGGRRRAESLVREVLGLAGLRPSDRLGQHFLIDDRAVGEFLKPLEKAAAEGIREALEIGPGAGSITLPAAEVLDRIVAVELDNRLASALSRLAPARVAVITGDGVSHAAASQAPLVFSNTPFNLSPAIVEALAVNNRVAAAVLGVQYEVARRMTARPGSRDYSRLSVLVSLVFHAELAGVVRPQAYYPRPQVLTAVVTLRRRRRWRSLYARALELAGCAFTQRNKKASKVLRRCLEAAGCAPPPWLDSLGDARVWMLRPEDFVGLAEACRG